MTDLFAFLQQVLVDPLHTQLKTEACSDCPQHLSQPVISPLPVCFQSPQPGRADAAMHGLQKTGGLDL